LAQSYRTIFHVDLDAFYVSVETLRNPKLRGMPVVVGSDPEGGSGRGVVVACSYEAREFGLKSGMPISRAYRLCPEAVYLRPDFELYRAKSIEVMKVLREYAEAFEQLSIDEAFLDVTDKVKNDSEALQLASDLQKALRARFGLSCSIGIGPNKSSAKIASDLKKPNGLTLIPRGRATQFFAPLNVSVIPGIGKKTRAFLEEKGIRTVGQLQSVPGKQLIEWFGKGGVWLWGVANVKENLPVRERNTPKSLSVERTFRHDVTDFSKVEDVIQDACAELIRRLKEANLEYLVAGIKVRFSGFETHTREKKLPGYTSGQEALLDAVNLLLKEFKNSSRPFRLVGVRVSQLRRQTIPTTSLSSWVEPDSP
jgi:DNA polymerase IV (DinB-like DNA polymerase)